jgi:hypothetical protein
MTRPSRSAPITGTSSLPWDGPPLCPTTGTQSLPVSADWDAPSRRARLAAAPDHIRLLAVHSAGDRFHVPRKSPSQAGATSMPDTAWPVSRTPARLIPGYHHDPGFDVVYSLSTRQRWFTHVRLLGSHLTHSRRAFSATLTTPALNRRSLRWFEASPCRATPEGQTSISRTASHSARTIFYIAPPPMSVSH